MNFIKPGRAILCHWQGFGSELADNPQNRLRPGSRRGAASAVFDA